MEVEIAGREIRLTIEENSINHKIIDNFCKKNFSNILKLSNTMIIYHRDNELSKKKYFLNWVYTAYKKTNKQVKVEFLQELQSLYALPVRVKIKGKKNILHGIKIRITFPHKNLMRMNIEALNNVPVTYFSHVFKKGLIEVRGRDIDIKTTVTSITELRRILDRDKILGLPVTFTFNEKIVNKLFAKLDEKLKTKRSKTHYSNNSRFKNRERREHRNHHSINEEVEVLENSYKILNCLKDDSEKKIKKQYLKLVKEFHPDTVYGQGEDIIEHYTKKFQEISDAYSTIQKSLNKVA